MGKTTPPAQLFGHLHSLTTPRLRPGGPPAQFASTPASGSGSTPTLREALSGTPVGRRLNDLERIADMDADKQQDLLQAHPEHGTTAGLPLRSHDGPLQAFVADPIPSSACKHSGTEPPQTHQRRFLSWVQEQMDGEQ